MRYVLVTAGLFSVAMSAQAQAPSAPGAETQAPSTPAPTSAAAPSGPRVIAKARTGMATRLEIKVFADDPAAAEQAIDAALAEMDRIEALTSEWKPDSEIGRLNGAAGKEAIKMSPETFAVLQRGKEVSKLSHGLFALSWAALAGLWHFDGPDSIVPEAAVARRRTGLIDDDKISLDPEAGTARLNLDGMAVGLGAIAKGYATDRALAVLKERGFPNALVFAGGDIVVGGKKGDASWMVGIQDPRAPGYFAVLPVQDEAVATSGDYEKFFIKDGVRYHHILDPRTGFPARGCRSVTVLAKTGMDADAFATAVFVSGPEEGLKLVQSQPGIETLIIDDKNNVVMSPGLKDRVRILKSPTPDASPRAQPAAP